MKKLLYISFIFFIFSCGDKSERTQLQEKWSELFGENQKEPTVIKKDSTTITSVVKENDNSTLGNQRENLVNYSKQFIGTPYLYGSADPNVGFDCSGFINHVYKRFGYQVPRSSKDFVNFGRDIEISDAKKGDLIIFNGTELNSPEVGHIGIIINPNGMNSDFIHSSSGKANGVTISSLGSEHYTQRFVKVISIVD